MPDQTSTTPTEPSCATCNGSGIMQLVFRDLSREPWPCIYCDAGVRVRSSWENPPGIPNGSRGSPD